MAIHRGHAVPILTGLFFLVLSVVAVRCAPAAEDLYAVGTRGSSAIAVGDGGRVLRAYPAPHNLAWNSAGWVSSLPLRAVTAGGTDYFAVGDGGTIVQSTDIAGQGLSWMSVDSGTAINFYGVSHGGARMVAVGDSAAVFLSSSLEGGAWQRVPPREIQATKRLRGVASNVNFVVAVGDSGTIAWTRSTILQVWDKTGHVPTTRDLYGVASEPVGSLTPRFWAVGDGGTILLSPSSPAGTWVSQTAPVAANLRAVAMNRLLPDNVLICVAVGEGGTILRSTDTATWTQVDSGTLRNLYGVAYTGSGSGGGFVAVGEQNTILWSPNGLAWSNVVVPVEKSTWGTIRGAWRNSGSGR
jgi:hypothetical protein